MWRCWIRRSEEAVVGLAGRSMLACPRALLSTRRPLPGPCRHCGFLPRWRLGQQRVAAMGGGVAPWPGLSICAPSATT